MIRFSFVILHYLDVDDTTECINSILDLNIRNYDVIINVIDNGSYNGSYEKLQHEFKNNVNVLFTKNDENVGFARGNNIGYRIAKVVNCADFIVVLNSDTVITDNQFLEKVEQSYNEVHYYVMGPDLVTMNSGHQNPIESDFDIDKCKKTIRSALLMYIMELLGINSVRRLLNLTHADKRSRSKAKEKSKTNVALHGAFLIYSPIFLQESDLAFYPKTFLYMEENILYYLCCKSGFKTYYNSDICVLHKEDVSARILKNSDRKRMMFTYKHIMNSAKEFIKLIESGDGFRDISGAYDED